MLPTSCTARLSGQPLSPPTTQPTTPRPLLCPAAVEVQQPHRWNDAADFARAAVITHALPSQLFPPTSFAPCSLPSLHKASSSFVCGSVLSKGHTRKRPKKDTLFFEPYDGHTSVYIKKRQTVNTKQKMFFSRVPAKEKTSCCSWTAARSCNVHSFKRTAWKHQAGPGDEDAPPLLCVPQGREGCWGRVLAADGIALLRPLMASWGSS